MRISPPHGAPALFSDHRALKRITKSSFWLHTSVTKSFPLSTSSSPTPLELWHVPWRPGNVLFWPPFKDSPLVARKCCQWAIFTLQSLEGPACNDPSKWGIKAWSVDMLHNPEGPSSLSPHRVSQGHLAHDPAWFFPLLYPVSSLLIPQVLILTIPLINIPTPNSIWVYIQKKQSVTYIKKFQNLGRIFIWKFLVIHVTF